MGQYNTPKNNEPTLNQIESAQALGITRRAFQKLELPAHKEGAFFMMLVIC